MMVSKKKQLAMDSSKVLLQKVDGSLKSFRSQPLQKTLTPNTLILGPGNIGLPGSTWLGSPYQSCFCAVTKRGLWTGQGAGGGRAPSVIVDGSVKDDPDDLERKEAMFTGPFTDRVNTGPYSTKQKRPDKVSTVDFPGASQCTSCLGAYRISLKTRCLQ